MEQCSILFLRASGVAPSPHPAALQRLGFLVAESGDLPDAADILSHHVVIVATIRPETLAMLALRIRMKRLFGRRVLVGLVPAGTPQERRRMALDSGFDGVLDDDCETRRLAAVVLRRVKALPEHRCVRRGRDRRRKVA